MKKKRYQCNICGWIDKPWRGDVVIYKYAGVPRWRLLCPVCKKDAVIMPEKAEKVYGD